MREQDARVGLEHARCPNPSSEMELGVENEAVSCVTPLIVIVAGLLLPEYEPVPVPAQVPNLYTPLAVARIETGVPTSYHPVSPEIVGLVVAADDPPAEGELTNVS